MFLLVGGFSARIDDVYVIVLPQFVQLFDVNPARIISRRTRRWCLIGRFLREQSLIGIACQKSRSNYNSQEYQY